MTYKLTEEQLKQLMEDAIRTALEKVAVIDEPIQEDAPQKNDGTPVTPGMGIPEECQA